MAFSCGLDFNGEAAMVLSESCMFCDEPVFARLADLSGDLDALGGGIVSSSDSLSSLEPLLDVSSTGCFRFRLPFALGVSGFLAPTAMTEGGKVEALVISTSESLASDEVVPESVLSADFFCTGAVFAVGFGTGMGDGFFVGTPIGVKRAFRFLGCSLIGFG